jgi:hypothetical protein
MVGKIFINYRRGDDPGNTGRLFDRLQEVFAPERLFMDVENIAPGLDFEAVLEDYVRKCAVLLAVIGPRWLEATDEHGNRRLDQPDDFVRIEIESALIQDKRVIPVLVGGAQMPHADELPEAIRPIARRNWVRLTHERFRSDTQGLIKALQEALHEAESTHGHQERLSRIISMKKRERDRRDRGYQGEFYENPLIFILTNPDDTELALRIREVLLSQNLPNENVITAQDREDRWNLEFNFRAADAVVFIYGRSRMAWLRRVEAYYLRLKSRMRLRPKMNVILLAPGADPRQSIGDLSVIDCRDGVKFDSLRKAIEQLIR